uniref:Predicted protein n=1 Tax=Hordeum vulgare subsp. vulgare TaxID=112509 RepID=F2DD60_HORVV|nr:predicted protein [Hordeum vulgare subsp. vulgare]
MAPAPLPLLVAAFSLLFAAATPIRDVADACSSQVQAADFEHLNSTAMHLPLHHSRGPCSPVSVPSDLPFSALLTHDDARIASLAARLAKAAPSSSSARPRPTVTVASLYRANDDAAVDGSLASVPLTPGTSYGVGNYVTRMGLGTPAKPYIMVVDTGSSLTWLVLPLPGVVPPAVRPGVRPQDVQLLRRRLLLHAAVQRPLHRHAQPGRLLLLRRLHLPGQLRRQLLLRRLPQQGHRLLRLQQRAQLLLRVRAGQRGALRPLRRPHGPGTQQALAALPARAHPRLLLLLLPPLLLLLRLPLHRLLQPGPVLLHAHGVQHARRLALLHQALRDDRRREAAGRVVLRILQPAHHHRLRHGHHAPAHHRLRRPQQGGGGGHEGDQARRRILHPRHVLRGPGVQPARPGGQHGLLRRRRAQAVGAEPARRRGQLHDVPRVRAREERRHHREHAAADVQRRLRRQEQQDRLRRRRLHMINSSYGRRCTRACMLGMGFNLICYYMHVHFFNSPVRSTTQAQAC